MNGKKIAYFSAGLIIFLMIIFLFPMLGIIGNSDTQLGLNVYNALHNKVFSIWNEQNSGSELILPYFFSMLFQACFNLLNLSFSNIGIITLVLSALVLVTFKLVSYLLKTEIDRKSSMLIFFISLFSVSNSYVVTSLAVNSTMIWTFFLFVLSLYCFFKYHFEKNFLYIVSFSLSVMLMSIDLHMSALTMIFIFSYIFIEVVYDGIATKKINWKMIYEPFLILALFFLFNSSWIIANMHDLLINDGSSYDGYFLSVNNTTSVVDAISNLISPASTFAFYQVKDINKGLFFGIDSAGTYLLLVMIVTGIFIVKAEKNDRLKKIIIILMVQYLIFYSFSLGPQNPIGIFNFFWEHIPGFKIFRDFSKFTRPIIPIMIILASYSAVKLIQLKRFKYPVMTFILVVFTLKFVPYIYNYKQYAPFMVPDYYYDFYEFTKNNKLQDKTQLLPVISWYQGYTWSNQAYDMNEPIGYFTAKPMFVNGATYEKNQEEILNEKILELLIKDNRQDVFMMTGFRNMKYFLLRNDLQNEYLKKKKINIKSIEDALNNNGDIDLLRKFGDLSLYSIGGKYFLPHFYVPKNSIISKRTTDELTRIFEQENYDISSAVFFEKQNEERARALNNLKEKNENSPVLEIKKINPTKYRIRVHGASGVFPLVFSESFHDGWRMYLAKPNNFQFPISNDQIGYKILDNNEGDQASKNELIQYVKNGWVTTLGDRKEKTIVHKKWENMKEKKDYTEKYKIDFVSKNFQGTIQNDNLPDGNLTETWFKKPIDDNENHLMVNGYANSWAINPENLCKNNNFCTKNPDGTYDFEIVAEFWPQRLFYIGLFISTGTLLASLIYLLYNYKRR